METYLYDEMFRLEQRHWWFAAKHRIVLDLLARSGVKAGAKVADIGCGCGRMLELLASRYDAIGVDASPLAIEFSKQRGVRMERGVLPDGLNLPKRSFDAALMLDVLEHLDDDVVCASAVAALLKDDGILLVTVPAYQWLYGAHDAAHHHRRRYTKRQLQRVLKQAGLKVRLISYYNTLLFPLALGQRAAQKLFPPKGPVSTHMPPAPINAALRNAFASERHLVGRVPLPMGLSLIAVAQR